MSIYFDRNDFLEFFNEEDVVEKYDELIMYSFSTDEFTFSLFLLGYRKCSNISLIKHKNSHTIFDISLENISKITCNETSLFFYKGKESEIDLSKPDYTVVVKPKVSIDWQVDNFYKSLD